MVGVIGAETPFPELPVAGISNELIHQEKFWN
jgi:hypothetical protein